jgi:hypothetical protein
VNTHAIAAYIATHTPLGTRYEEPRRMGMCDNCHGNHHIQQCPEVARFDLVARLREALADVLDVGEWTWSEADDATLFTIHLRESHYTELMNLINPEEGTRS